MRILITGRPGVGKTTLVKRLSECVRVCGFYTEEVRERGRRIGFDGVNIRTGERVPVARVGGGPPRVGKYGVFLEGVERLIEWLEGCEEIVFVDEIGPMELKHPGFGNAVVRSAERSKIFLATVHRKIAGEWSLKLGAELITITEENREEVYRFLLQRLTSPSL